MAQKHRVIQWSTGQMGKLTLGGIIGHPDLELAGVWCHNHEKEGVDAGELCGFADTGITATSDAGALLALDADCVVYAATDTMRSAEAIDDLCMILAAGKNVATVSVLGHYPANFGDDVHDRLAAACEAGGSSLYGSGIYPGFADEVMCLALTSGTRQVESVGTFEFMNVADYADPVLFSAMGIGKPIEEAEQVAEAGLIDFAGQHLWRAMLMAVAEGLGVELDDVEYSHEYVVTPDALDTPGLDIAAGTVGAVHIHLDGMIGGKARVLSDAYYWWHPDFYPSHWPTPPSPGGGHRAVLKGIPNLQLDLSYPSSGTNTLVDAGILCCSRVVNSVPAVCVAEPGIRTYPELPPVVGRLDPVAEPDPTRAGGSWLQSRA